MATDPLFDPLRARITADYRRAERNTLAPLVAEAGMSEPTLRTAQALAATLAEAVRAERHKAGGVDALMLEFSLDSREGIALMCLAEALLRIPDAAMAPQPSRRPRSSAMATPTVPSCSC